MSLAINWMAILAVTLRCCQAKTWELLECFPQVWNLHGSCSRSALIFSLSLNAAVLLANQDVRVL